MKTEKIKKQIEKIYIEMKKELKAMGVKYPEETKLEWYIPQNNLWQMDFKQFQIFLGKGRSTELDDFVKKTNEFIEFARKLKIVESIEPHIEYIYPLKNVRIYFMWKNETPLKLDEENWKRVFEEYGYSKEAQEFEIKWVFQKKETAKKISTFITNIGQESKINREVVSEIVYEKVWVVMERAQKELDELRCEVKNEMQEG